MGQYRARDQEGQPLSATECLEAIRALSPEDRALLLAQLRDEDEYGEGDPAEDRRKRSRDTWPRRPGRDGEILPPRGSETPGAIDEAMKATLKRSAREIAKQYAGDSAPERDAFFSRYPDARRIKTTGLF
jgi:hypothetical protein